MLITSSTACLLVQSAFFAAVYFVSAPPGGQCCICGGQMIRRPPVNTKKTAGKQPKSSKETVRTVPAKTSQKDMTGKRPLRFGAATGRRCSKPKRTFRRCAACDHKSPKNSKHQHKLPHTCSLNHWSVDVQRNNSSLPPNQCNEPLDCGQQFAYVVMADKDGVKCLQIVNCEEVEAPK